MNHHGDENDDNEPQGRRKQLKRRDSFVKIDWLSDAVNNLRFPQLSEDALNIKLLRMRYEVRGMVVQRALQLKNELSSSNTLPFTEVVLCNIGNPHRLGQKPITFMRQILSCCVNPELLSIKPPIYPVDVIDRARKYLKEIVGGVGAYSNSLGIPYVRDEIASFIRQRDAHSCHADNIYLVQGASAAVKSIIAAFIGKSTDGCMIPIPQYPLYSASLTLAGGEIVGYYLNEENNWNTNTDELQRAYDNAVENGIRVRLLVIINPGNPTGQCLKLETMQNIVRFCFKNQIILIADEVYQTNIWESTPFISFHKVIHDMHGEDEYYQPLVSLHSISKGFIGECGLRGGYMHLHAIPDDVKKQLYKYASVSLCPNVIGQIAVGIMVNPPIEGDESYELYKTEETSILSSLRRRATLVVQRLNQLENVSCEAVEGALYAFPKIILPSKAIDEAKSLNIEPDTLYCLQLLEHTGVVVVPGSGFLQRDNTFHFRITILPPEDKIDHVFDRIAAFHEAFMKKRK